MVSKQECDGYGIDRVADVECGLRFYEDKTYDDIAVVDNISIKTDISGSYEQRLAVVGLFFTMTRVLRLSKRVL